MPGGGVQWGDKGDICNSYNNKGGEKILSSKEKWGGSQ